jgi:hypothetical protein
MVSKKEKGNLPISKSWAIRMIFLDMLYGARTEYKIINYFKKQNKKDLAEDINAALQVVISYLSGKNIYNVGNSGKIWRKNLQRI